MIDALIKEASEKITNRGPDSLNRKEWTLRNGTKVVLLVSVLSMQRNVHLEDGVIRQPILLGEREGGLGWNGEAWDVAAKHSDTVEVRDRVCQQLDLLGPESASTHRAVSIALDSVIGPWSACVIDVQTSTVCFGRDAIGRRSLLLRLPTASCMSSEPVIVSSVVLPSTSGLAALREEGAAGTPPEDPLMSDDRKLQTDLSVAGGRWQEVPAGWVLSCSWGSQVGAPVAEVEPPSDAAGTCAQTLVGAAREQPEAESAGAGDDQPEAESAGAGDGPPPETERLPSVAPSTSCSEGEPLHSGDGTSGRAGSPACWAGSIRAPSGGPAHVDVVPPRSFLRIVGRSQPAGKGDGATASTPTGYTSGGRAIAIAGEVVVTQDYCSKIAAGPFDPGAAGGGGGDRMAASSKVAATALVGFEIFDLRRNLPLWRPLPAATDKPDSILLDMRPKAAGVKAAGATVSTEDTTKSRLPGDLRAADEWETSTDAAIAALRKAVLRRAQHCPDPANTVPAAVRARILSSTSGQSDTEVVACKPSSPKGCETREFGSSDAAGGELPPEHTGLPSDGSGGQLEKPARVAVLFSGGLDCTIVARLADEVVPHGEPIDLLSACFDSPRHLSPDRKTALQSWMQLRRCCPSRLWRLILVNVSPEAVHGSMEHVAGLLWPRCTNMDLSLGMAIWHAAGGTGRLATDSDAAAAGVSDGPAVIGESEAASGGGGGSEEAAKVADLATPAFTSTARVLLSGLGADELCGGYGRHATAVTRGGWPELAKELSMDVDRLWARNLGRDDRIVSDRGKELRLPMLDEGVLKALASIRVDRIIDPSRVKGQGDKRVLRLVAARLGLGDSATLPKRAVQFGSRVAKVLNVALFGSSRQAKGASSIVEALQRAQISR